MAAFDGTRTIRAPEFDEDKAEQTFTLCRADNDAQFNYSMIRFEKIFAGRYKGWALAIPPEFKEYVKERTFRQHWYEDAFVKSLSGESILRPKERTAAHQ